MGSAPTLDAVLLDACGEDLTGLRGRALLSLAYETGLRMRELVAMQVEDLIEAIDPEARLLRVARSKGDPEEEGPPLVCRLEWRAWSWRCRGEPGP